MRPGAARVILMLFCCKAATGTVSFELPHSGSWHLGLGLEHNRAKTFWFGIEPLFPRCQLGSDTGSASQHLEREMAICVCSSVVPVPRFIYPSAD